MKILEKLLGGIPRVKLMRMFLFNPESAFDLKTIAERTKVPVSQVRKDLVHLYETGLIRKKSVLRFVPARSKKTPAKKKKCEGWILDTHFTYINELRQLVLNTTLMKNSDIIKRLHKSGKIKLIVLAGLFIQNPDSRLDLFVVGDGIKRVSLDNAVKTIESEIGKELRFISFETEEFFYRLSMYDKLIRDVLDFPHEKILNRLSF